MSSRVGQPSSGPEGRGATQRSRVGQVWEHKGGTITLLIVAEVAPAYRKDSHAWEALTLHDAGRPGEEGTARAYAEEFFTEQGEWWRRIA